MVEPIYVDPFHFNCAVCGCSHTTREDALNCDCRRYKTNNETLTKKEVKDVLKKWLTSEYEGAVMVDRAYYKIVRDLKLGDEE